VDLTPGTILLGKYRIDELIGTGGMGNVVRASHLYLHQAVAIKLLLPQMAESESTKQRFLREAQATVKLKSEHSARVMDVGTTPDGLPFMVMEFLDGSDLNQILRHHGPQAPAIVVDLMLQACEGIAEAHALGIVHRDVKPSNFFITRRPDGSMLLKILDFGISKTPIGYDELTGTQTVIGTPSYMAPEQMKSGRAADPRSDIWSIGVVMYQLINGRPPFSGESYAELVLKVGLEPPSPMLVPLPSGLPEVIFRCLEKDPNARHQNVGDLARMLAPYASDPQSAAQSAGRASRILHNRGAQMGQMGPMGMGPMGMGMIGMQGSPLSAGGGLATPIPISPAQLTPRSWPASQATSLSQGAGQVTVRTRGNRGLLIAGVTSLCVLAGTSGYIISQMSRGGARNDSHVSMPQPVTAASDPPATPTAPPAAVPPSATAPATTPPPATAPAAPPPPATAPAATPPTATAPATTPPPTTAPPPSTAPVAAPPSGSDRPLWKESPTVPTLPDHPAAKPADDDDAARPAADAARPSPKHPADAPRPAIKHTPPSETTRPATRPASDTSKPTGKSTGKGKKSDDLFDSRH
jgi:serine/threonine-protein kinase